MVLETWHDQNILDTLKIDKVWNLDNDNLKIIIKSIVITLSCCVDDIMALGRVRMRFYQILMVHSVVNFSTVPHNPINNPWI